MTDLKNKITNLQSNLVNALTTESADLPLNIVAIRQLLDLQLHQAIKAQDGMTQLFCCLAEAHINVICENNLTTLFEDAKNFPINEIKDAITSLTETDTSFIVAKEKGMTYPNQTLMLDADSYGLYYVVNDHYSKEWDNEDYTLSQNGSKGHPLITNLFKMCYLDDDKKPLYQISDEGYVERTNPAMNMDAREVMMHLAMGHMNFEDVFNMPSTQLRDELLNIFDTHGTTIFPNLKVAFLGAAGVGHDDVVSPLAAQFDDFKFLDYSPYAGTGELNLTSPIFEAENEDLLVDYVVSSNVLNAYGNHIKDDERDQVFAAAAKLLKRGGKAVHIMEKTANQKHFNVNLSRSLHHSVGQELVYNFFREKGAMDLVIDKRKNMEAELVDIPSDFSFQGFGRLSRKEKEKLKEEAIQHIHEHNEYLLLSAQAGRESGERATLDGKPDDFRTSMLVLLQTEKPVITSETVQETRTKLNNYQHKFNYYKEEVYVPKPKLQF